MYYAAKILADSMSPSGIRLTTFELCYPRIVHAEFMTHRMFSRNASSSRAIPTTKMIEMVEEAACPILDWGKNQSGMQARERLTGQALLVAKHTWAEAKQNALQSAKELHNAGAHKQIVNRLLEPFSWITVVCSATTYENFFNLRCHPDAQPEIQYIAKLMQTLYLRGEPKETFDHLPYITENDTVSDIEKLRRISVARCARVSYLSRNSEKTYDEDMELCNKLLSSQHLSPFEHVAKLRESDKEYPASNFHSDWVQFRKELEMDLIYK